MESLMGLALNAFGATTNEAVVELLWKNLYGTAPTTQQAEPYVEMLRTQQMTPGALGVLAAVTALNVQRIDLVGLERSGLDFTLNV